MSNLFKFPILLFSLFFSFNSTSSEIRLIEVNLKNLDESIKFQLLKLSENKTWNQRTNPQKINLTFLSGDTATGDKVRSVTLLFKDEKNNCTLDIIVYRFEIFEELFQGNVTVGPSRFALEKNQKKNQTVVNADGIKNSANDIPHLHFTLNCRLSLTDPNPLESVATILKNFMKVGGSVSPPSRGFETD